jgi:hypothetical protein
MREISIGGNDRHFLVEGSGDKQSVKIVCSAVGDSMVSPVKNQIAA